MYFRGGIMPRLNHRWKPLGYKLRDTKVGLTKLINKLEQEAVFPEEWADIELLKETLKLLDIYDLQPANKKRCPFCNSKQLAEAVIENVDLTALCKNATKGTTRNTSFKLRICRNCGVYELKEIRNFGLEEYYGYIRRSKEQDSTSND